MPGYFGGFLTAADTMSQIADRASRGDVLRRKMAIEEQQAPYDTARIKAQSELEGAKVPYASELAQVPVLEQRRKQQLDSMRNEAAGRKNQIAQQLADAKSEAVRLSGDLSSPTNKIKLAQAVANIESLQDRMNHESRLEQQYLFQQGFADTPFSPNSKSSTLGRLQEMLGNQQRVQQQEVPSEQPGMVPPQPGSPIPQSVQQGRLVTTDEQGRRIVIPPNEIPSAQRVMQASEQGQPLTLPGNTLTAPRVEGQIPEDLMKLPIAARMKTYNERMAEVPAQTAKLNASVAALDNVSDVATLSLKHGSLGPATGLTGMLMSNIPGTGAYNVKEIVESLEAKLAFASLGDLRQQSKTGGALGQVSDKEEQMLKKAIASLKLAQSEEDVRRALSDVVNYSQGAKSRLLKAYEQTYAEKPDLTEYHTITSPKNPNERVITPKGGVLYNGYQFPSQQALDAYKAAGGK